jgi:hypothetical protein
MLRREFRTILPILIRDLGTIVCYGLNAPRKYQRLFVEPWEISELCLEYERQFGVAPYKPEAPVVAAGSWDTITEPICNRPAIRLVRERLIEGRAWTETSVFISDHGRRRWKTLEDLLRHYQALDQIIEQVRTEGRLRTAGQLARQPFRERGGIGVLVARDGKLLKSSNGNHRFGIAVCLGLKTIPVAVHAVHPECIRSGTWCEVLRKSKHLERSYYTSGNCLAG